MTLVVLKIGMVMCIHNTL